LASEEILMKTSRMVAAGLSALLILPIIGCSGGGYGGTSYGGSGTATITQTQELAATSDIFSAMAVATASAGYFEPGVGKAEASGIRNSTPSDSPVVTYVGAPRFISPLTSITLGPYTYTCPSGGTIIVNGSVSGTPTSSSFNVTETINSCADSGITFNGNPNVTIAGSATESGNVFTDSVTMMGGFTYSGGSCLINVTVNANINTSSPYSETVNETGSVCGVSLNYSYSGTA
jgi:hypothetical protein